MIIQGIAKSASVFLAALVCAVAIAGVGRGAAQDQSPPPPQDQSRPDQAPVDAAPYAKMSRDQLGRPPRSLNGRGTFSLRKLRRKSVSRVQVRVQTPVWVIYAQLC